MSETRATFRSALQDPEVQILAVSRAASKLAMASVSYGAMVYLATRGASQLQISLVAASSYAAALVFGIQGGMLSDSLSKRIALVVGYVAQALLCVLTPFFWGTDVAALMFIMFMASGLNQIITPSIKAATALVSTPSQLATVAAVISIVGSVSSALGAAVMAPLLIKFTSIKVLLSVAAAIYLLGALRTFRLPQERRMKSVGDMIRSVEWKPKALSLRWNAQWIVNHRGVATMILAGGIVVALSEAFNTLIPVYLRDVLKSDAANAAYIFAPGMLGYLVGTVFSPRLIQWFGERKVALTALLSMSLAMMLFGSVQLIASTLAPVSPLRPINDLLGLGIDDKVLAAGAIAILASFGSTAAASSVQVYINRRVPLVRQGATFGLQEVQENGLMLVAVVVLGGIANAVGAQAVFILAPLVAIGVVTWIIDYSHRSAGDRELSSLEALGMLSDGSLDAIPPPARKRTSRKRPGTGARKAKK